MPSARWTDRTIRGPSADYLSADEFGKLFNLSGDTVTRMTKEGLIPAPIRVSKQSTAYTWDQVVYYSLRLKFIPLESETGEGVKGKGVEKTSATGG